ncbi:MAG: DUF2782 domain-containing protein [Luteimonas sp.]
MHARTPIATFATVLLSTGLLAACASNGAALRTAQDGSDGYAIPDGAVEDVSTASNGDTVHEYRVQGQLRMIKVVPLRGPTYYLLDRNGDGKVNQADGEAPAVYYKLFSW